MNQTFKKRYPYLIYWKERGFKEFPTIPPDVILDKAKKSFEKSYTKTLNNSVYSRFLPEEVVQARLQETLNSAKPLLDEMTANICQAQIDTTIYEMGMQDIELLKKFKINGDSRDKIIREWGRKTLPQTKGGPAILSRNVRYVLKKVYKELIKCIKEVRKKLDVPLTNTENYKYDSDVMPGEIKELVPSILLIFNEEELPLLIDNPSIKDTAFKIMHNRLRRCVLNPITSRTLENILYKTP